MRRARDGEERLSRDVRTRVSPGQRDRILAAAARLAKTPADFIRDAALSRADEVLDSEPNLCARFEPFIGILDAPVTRSTATGRDLAEIMRRRHEE